MQTIVVSFHSLMVYSVKLFKLLIYVKYIPWNDLDQDISNNINVDSFKNKLDNFLKCRG